MTTLLLSLSSKKLTGEATDLLVSAYYGTLKPYTDDQVMKAGYAYMEDEHAFYPPKPHELIKHIPSVGTDKHDAELRKRFTCFTCDQKVPGISDGMCLRCAGVPDVSYPEPPRNDKESDFAIRDNGSCQECGRNNCRVIKEPKEDGIWVCQVCYTGLKPPQIAARFKHLWQIMAGKVEGDTPFPG